MCARTCYSLVNLRMLDSKHGKKESYVGQVCWPLKKSSAPWIVLAGDGVFFGLHKKFARSDLDACDYPLILAVRRGKVKIVMDFLEKNLPGSAKMLVVYVGAADLTASRIGPKQAARELYERCLRLRKAHPNLEEIAVCLLSHRLPTTTTTYRKLYIKWFNRRVREFNRCISCYDQSGSRLSLIDLGLQLDDNISSNLHDETALGANESAQDLIAGSLASLIKFKRSTSNSSGRRDHGTPSCLETNLNRCVTLPRTMMTTSPSFYQTRGDPVKLSLSLPATPYSGSEIPHSSHYESRSEVEKRTLDPEFHDEPKKLHSNESSYGLA